MKRGFSESGSSSIAGFSRQRARKKHLLRGTEIITVSLHVLLASAVTVSQQFIDANLV
jgi:hypothetical protein